MFKGNAVIAELLKGQSRDFSMEDGVAVPFDGRESMTRVGQSQQDALAPIRLNQADWSS